jgi:hypothetical protein
MKKKVILLLIIPILLSTKCKLDLINIEIENKSNDNLIVTNSKDTTSLRLLLNQNIENNESLNQVIYVTKIKTSKIAFDEYDLDFYTFHKNNEKYYNFYYLIYKKIDNKIIFKSKINNVYYKTDEFKTGENEVNRFFYANNKLVFEKGN